MQARVRFHHEIDESDVDEASRLMHISKASLLEHEDTSQTAKCVVLP